MLETMETRGNTEKTLFVKLQEILADAYLNANAPKVMQKNVRCSDNEITIGTSKFSLSSFNKIYVAGAGLSAFQMAQHIENILEKKVSQGIILVPPDFGGKLTNIQVREVTSPLIDQQSAKSLKDLLSLVGLAQKDDLVIMLLSKGAEEILEMLPDGISFNEYNTFIKQLKSSGMRDEDVSCIRMHLSKLKGGQLLRHIKPATSISVILSDLPGGDVRQTYLAPTSFDPTDFNQCRRILIRHKMAMKLSNNLSNYFNLGMQGKIPDTLKPNDPIFEKVHNLVIHDSSAFASDAMQAAIKNNIRASVLSTHFNGNPRILGKFFGSILRDIGKYGILIDSPGVLVSSGRLSSSEEDRVEQCAKIALMMAIEIQDMPGAHFLAATSFQYDNSGPIGCIVTGDTVNRMRKAGIDPIDVILQNKEYQVLKNLNQVIEGQFQVNDCGELFLMGVS
jgi:glycerate 2-kinase